MSSLKRLRSSSTEPDRHHKRFKGEHGKQRVLHLDDLAEDLLLAVLLRLDSAQDLVTIARCSSKWNRLASDGQVSCAARVCWPAKRSLIDEPIIIASYGSASSSSISPHPHQMH